MQMSTVNRDNLPIGQRSILGNILPTAVLNMLANYGPERFAAVFTGEFDTPEVIWKASLRRHVVEMIDLHIGTYLSLVVCSHITAGPPSTWFIWSQMIVAVPSLSFYDLYGPVISGR